MQCLSSPTRAEINKAHNEERWLDIGVLSVKNLRRVSWRRICLWWCLALSSIPLHLFYNSAIFSTLSAHEYLIFTVDANFPTGSSFNLKETNFNIDKQISASESAALERSLDWLHDNISSLTKLDKAACIKAYGNDYVSSYSDLLLVSSTKNATNSLLSWDSSSPRFFPYIDDSGPYDWICSGDWDSLGYKDNFLCDPNAAAAKADKWVVGSQPIDYCLSRKIEEHCRLQFSLAIMVIVIL